MMFANRINILQISSNAWKTAICCKTLPLLLKLLVATFVISNQITFANSLDPDQDQQNVGPDLDPNCLTILIGFLGEFFEKVIYEKKKSAEDNKSMKKSSACQEFS